MGKVCLIVLHPCAFRVVRLHVPMQRIEPFRYDAGPKLQDGSLLRQLAVVLSAARFAGREFN